MLVVTECHYPYAWKGLAKLLVICRLTPNNMEKMKKIAIRFCLNKANARNPNASTKLFCSV